MYFLSKELYFPPVDEASIEGVVAIGGDLSVERLQLAYRCGIFPWFNEDEPIIWWCPDPRLVLFPKEIQVSKSMKQILKKGEFEFSINTDFEAVIRHCRNTRVEDGTWISEDIIQAYLNLHEAGFAHSFEVRKNNELVGGLYGVGLGKVFFGESMFSLMSNASKAALIFFCLHAMQEGIELIDCQQSTSHLQSMGAREISRDSFLELLDKLIEE
jgi:leucyl/phenylalanyl-tRNA--protein transferase